MKELLKPIQDSIDRLLLVKDNIEVQEGQIKQLKYENWKLTTEVDYLKKEVKSIKSKINTLENKSLERNLIFHGLHEGNTEVEEDRAEKIYGAISATINHDTPEERLQIAREVELVKTRCLGKKDPTKTRPISVEFSNKYDVEQIYANRFNMDEGIYVDREYNQETEWDCRLLRPILKAAKKLTEYKKKCQLDGNELVLDGTRYTKENLHLLPRSLEIMSVTTKSDDNVLAFFGELCPLSNFYHSSFLFKGIEYHSSEQFIQHMKAKHFSTSMPRKQSYQLKPLSTVNKHPGT